ncbi:sigma-70 family RNA polymerase sigma factor [Harryflintia acetispora]|uniref:sigma-70 family RNA polymerase sigma factor n=1 Tax=Harryflintia acetispora TaxID=1849041 RepID=UPI00189B0126|nr:sigma-70 family RNA polymerase sigma factor [Harryflintia acetispora]
MKQEINGENFLGALRRQDERALDYLVEHYAGLIRSVVSRKLYALPAWQEDCQNDILYEVWKNAKRFDGERCSFEGWVAAIARCRCVDYLRRYLDGRSSSLDGLEPEPAADDSTLRAEAREELESLLSCLNERDRELFLCYYLGGEDVDSLSKRSGLRPAAVYNRLSRGRRRLRRLYESGNQEE